jgi:hypothetical protein
MNDNEKQTTDGSATSDTPHYFTCKGCDTLHVKCHICGHVQRGDGDYRYCGGCGTDLYVELCPVCHHMGPHIQKLTPEEAPGCCPWGGHPLLWSSTVSEGAESRETQNGQQ